MPIARNHFQSSNMESQNPFLKPSIVITLTHVFIYPYFILQMNPFILTKIRIHKGEYNQPQKSPV